jgi:hypothetical protein
MDGWSSDPRLQWEIDDQDAIPEGRVACLVWVGDGDRSTPSARARLLELASVCTGVVLVAEPGVAGVGIGRNMLRSMDPALLELATEEIPDGIGGSRERRPWEAMRTWAVAEVAAWRFETDAEAARDGFLARLPRLRGGEVVLACRRMLQYWPTAHEVFVLAGRVLLERGDRDALRALLLELQLAGEVPLHVRRAVEAAVGHAAEVWNIQSVTGDAATDPTGRTGS